MSRKVEVLEHVTAKGNNKRFTILLILRDDGVKVFRVMTKTLIDFKTRNIVETDSIYSIETFTVLSGLFEHFLLNHKIKNNILLKELAAITPFEATTSLPN